MDSGRLQVVFNGTSVVYPARGRSLAMAEPRDGENRIEATVVEGGREGTWRIEFAPNAIKAGSLRVITGNTVSVTETAVVVQLKGTAGERVVIGFVSP